MAISTQLGGVLAEGADSDVEQLIAAIINLVGGTGGGTGLNVVNLSAPPNLVATEGPRLTFGLCADTVFVHLTNREDTNWAPLGDLLLWRAQTVKRTSFLASPITVPPGGTFEAGTIGIGPDGTEYLKLGPGESTAESDTVNGSWKQLSDLWSLIGDFTHSSDATYPGGYRFQLNRAAAFNRVLKIRTALVPLASIVSHGGSTHSEAQIVLPALHAELQPDSWENLVGAEIIVAEEFISDDEAFSGMQLGIVCTPPDASPVNVVDLSDVGAFPSTKGKRYNVGSGDPVGLVGQLYLHVLIAGTTLGYMRAGVGAVRINLFYR